MQQPTAPSTSQPDTPAKNLTLLDSTCLIVGIIVGAGIYQVAPDVARGTQSWWAVLVIWGLGGLLSLCGAFGYAELGSAYPHEGGDYVYLSKAFGNWAGFLFGWLQMAVVRPGDIVVMAFAFATYGRAIYDPWPTTTATFTAQLYAATAVIILTLINIVGVRQGKWTQNTLTAVKTLGLLAIVVVAFFAPAQPTATRAFEPIPASVAMIMVLFTFGGWNEIAYVAAELKDPGRDIFRALFAGIAAVTALYLLVNGAFLYTLGFDGTAATDAVATDVVRTVFPTSGAALISALVCISALGAVNGLIFAGARISYAVGADHALFRPLGRWSQQTGTPIRALLLQGAIALTLIVFLKNFVETILYTAPAVYFFYLSTSLAVIVLRRRAPDVPRPYRVTGYPFTTLLFIAVCAFLIYSGVSFAIVVKQKAWIVLVPFAIMLLGLPLYWVSRRMGNAGERLA